MHEVFDHTADLGLRIRSDTLEGLFAEAGEALFDAIVAQSDTVRPIEKATFQIDGDRHDDLLRDWLAELLFAFHVDHRLFSKFEVRLGDAGLAADAWGEPIDDQRHEIDAEIKAITYHGLKVVQERDGWLAEVIVDI